MTLLDTGYEGVPGGRLFDGSLLYGGIKSGVGSGVWATDGSSVTLVKVLEPSPPFLGFYARPTLAPFATAVRGPNLYFAGYDSTHGCELWRTDGTPAGTVLHADINPGPDGSNNCVLADMVSIDSGLVFDSNDGTNGDELHICDDAGACSLIRDIHSGANDATPAALRRLSASSATFIATDGLSGRELWTTDGTYAGTALACDINPGSEDGRVSRSQAVLASSLYFAADDGTSGCELWRYTPGTGCSLVQDIAPGPSSGVHFQDPDEGFFSCSTQFAVVGSTLYFAANDGASGLELWKTDGTAAGTFLVEDINPSGDAFLSGSGPFAGFQEYLCSYGTFEMEELDGGVFFFATDGSSGCEPWHSDGTVAGTSMIEDLTPGTESSVFGPFLEGRVRVADPPSFVFGTQPDAAAVYGNRALAQCSSSGCEGEILSVDGSSDATVRVLGDHDVLGHVVAAETDFATSSTQLVSIPVPEPDGRASLFVGMAFLGALALRAHRREAR